MNNIYDKHIFLDIPLVICALFLLELCDFDSISITTAKRMVPIFWFLCLISKLIAFAIGSDVPIIGILSQETYAVNYLFPNESYQSFIAASYVKYLESAGARVVPIMIGKDVDYYKDIVEHTNGILFPGGATFFNETNGYADAGQILYDLAVKMNQNGHYYPIWGTCLGLELLAYVALRGEEIRSSCSSSKVALPLDFKEDFKKSKIFSSAPQEVIEVLSGENVTYNVHMYCLTEDSFEKHGMLENWRVLSTNKDKNGFEFISIFESKKYPFYAVQFHPEKNMFEFKANVNIPHSVNAVKVSQYFANFFVEETRRNNHSYPNWKSEQEALIYNYQPHFTGLQNSSYMQLYMFRGDENNNYISE